MFRMEFENVGPGVRVRIEGRFVGYFANEARQLIARRKIPAQLVVDLTEVTFVDWAGEEALTWLSQIGAKFIAKGCYALDVCDRLRLPLARSHFGAVRRYRAAM
jgi:hypothetical protein